MANLPIEVFFALAGLGLCQLVMFIILCCQIYRAPNPEDWIASVEEKHGPEQR